MGLRFLAAAAGLLLLSTTAVSGAGEAQLPTELSTLSDSFRQPPPDTRPGCYWYWINDNISKSGITKDLESMARVGIGRAHLGHIFSRKTETDTPVGNVPFMSDDWWAAVQWAVKEADRCGVEIGFFNAPGWSQSGGPWVKPSQSMRYLASSETVINGGRKVDLILPITEITTFPVKRGNKPQKAGDVFTTSDYKDVSVFAFRQPINEQSDTLMERVKVSAKGIKDIGRLTDRSNNTFVTVGPKEQDLTFDFATSETAQSLSIKPLSVLYTLHCSIECSDDGRNYRFLAKHSEERGHQGPRRMDPILIPFPETSAKHFRIKLKCSQNVSVAEVALSRKAVLSGYVRKQLGETSPNVRPPWDAYVWKAQDIPGAGSAVVSADVIDLSKQMDSNGKLVWDAPEGSWVVMRTGLVPIGTMCGPASPQSLGLEVDKMSREHVRSLFDGMVGEFLRRTPASERKALKYVIADSYETGPQNWTDGFIEKFEKRFGYSPVRFLPALTGRVVDSPDVSNRFLWDWRRLVVESIAYDYVGGLREIAAENNLTLWLENYGHWGFPSEFLLYGSQSDQVGGEFWEDGSPIDSVECRAASSCANIYGKTDVYAEAFTSGRNFKQCPADLKQWTDWVYSAGINHFILHVYVHQPDERKPGIIQWFGTEFNRHNTWFEQSKAFIDYTRRCSVMLKAGRPVIDVAYYIGENAPSMEGPRDPKLPDGYDFGYINSDVLIRSAMVEDGRIIIKNGPAYSVLVLPKETVMRPDMIKAIQRLVNDGATVLGPAPSTSPSFQNFPDADTEVRKIAGEVWGSVDGKSTKQRSYGKGRIMDGFSLAEALSQIGLLPDVELNNSKGLICSVAGSGRIGIHKNGGLVFKHRATGDSDVYFISNTTDRDADFTVALRQTCRKPWLCDAISGTMREAVAFSQKDGRTHIPLRLGASESVFVVLSGKVAPDASGVAASNTSARAELTAIEGPWTLHFEGQGAPETIVFNNLADWSTHTNSAIRHYSGTASYETMFKLTDSVSGEQLHLNLGDVGVIATVEINGRDMGTVWTRPWEIDISDAVRKGENRLRITVANTWHNRLAADASLPLADRKSYVSQPYKLDPKAKLVSSGLIGPVKIWKNAK